MYMMDKEHSASAVNSWGKNGYDGEDFLTGVMPLMQSSFSSDEVLRVINSFTSQERRDIAWAEYYYFLGQVSETIRITEMYLTHPSLSIRLSACLLYSYSCLSEHKITHARYGLSEIKKSLYDDGDQGENILAVKSFFAFCSATLLHIPLPEHLPTIDSVLSVLPTGLRSFLLYIKAHRLYLQQEYALSAGVAEATLAMSGQDYPIPAIYLHLVMVMDYMSLKRADEAKIHLLKAWEIARPIDFIEPFGEHHGLLGGTLEAVIKTQWPDDFKRMIDITYRFSSGWRAIHNPVTGNEVADDLTTTEFACAMLAARGWTNIEIAKHLSISANTVKTHLSNAMRKLGIESRKALKQYMLV